MRKQKFQTLAIFGAVIAALAASPATAQEEAEPTPNGFFDNDMKADSLVEGMDFGTRSRDSSSVGAERVVRGLGGGNRGKNANSAVVPEIERSNDYSVPERARPSTPSPTPSPAMEEQPAEEQSSEEQAVVVEEQDEPPGADYYQRLIDRARNPVRAPEAADSEAPPGSPALKPPKRPQSFTF